MQIQLISPSNTYKVLSNLLYNYNSNYISVMFDIFKTFFFIKKYLKHFLIS